VPAVWVLLAFAEPVFKDRFGKWSSECADC
jgi:hypothetical protein